VKRDSRTIVTESPTDRKRTAPCDGSKKGTEARGVEGITEGEEAREETALVVGEVGEGGEIARLVYLARGSERWVF
jgi:hypothetical protein